METVNFYGLEPTLCSDYNESMDALPELWATNSFDASMVVELGEDDDYQPPIWSSTGLTLDDDSDDDLNGVGSESAMLVLHDRLMTDASPLVVKQRPTPKQPALTYCPTNNCNKGMSNSNNHHHRVCTTRNSGSGPKMASLVADQHNTYSITISSRGEVEIFPDDSRTKNDTAELLGDPLSLTIKSEPHSPCPDDEDSDVAAPSRKRPLPTQALHRTIKIKPGRVMLTSERTDNVVNCTPSSTGSFMLPPTPPSSTSSDSEGSSSPVREAASPKSEPLSEDCAGGKKTSPVGRALSSHKASSECFNSSGSRHPINSPLISYQPKGSTGILNLTEEEKRTLLSEGYPVPTKLPLTKAEEKSLKKIRRKIKNKISAQESRRKKKEYMDTLERRAQVLIDENGDYRQRLEQLERDNATLQQQLARLQKLLEGYRESQI